MSGDAPRRPRYFAAARRMIEQHGARAVSPKRAQRNCCAMVSGMRRPFGGASRKRYARSRSRSGRTPASTACVDGRCAARAKPGGSTPCRRGQFKLASSNRQAIPEPTARAIGAQSRLGRFASIRIHRTVLSSAVLRRTAQMFTRLGIQTKALQSRKLLKSFRWRSTSGRLLLLNIVSDARGALTASMSRARRRRAQPADRHDYPQPCVSALGVAPSAHLIDPPRVPWPWRRRRAAEARGERSG
jgi:hypothetical protein